MANTTTARCHPPLPSQNWLLRLRRKGVAVLVIHHAGTKGGNGEEPPR
jgi:hypothetical protein